MCEGVMSSPEEPSEGGIQWRIFYWLFTSPWRAYPAIALGILVVSFLLALTGVGKSSEDMTLGRVVFATSFFFVLISGTFLVAVCVGTLLRRMRRQ